MLNYAIFLSRNGQHDEGLTTAKQASDIYQKLAQNNSEQFEPDWALSLNNYAIMLAEHDRHSDALATCKQALDLFQKLCNDKPERFEPNWANSLATYADCLAEQGLYQEALAVNEQALSICKSLAQTKPERFEPDWAMVLGNHPIYLRNQGHYPEALTAAQQACDMYQKLVQTKSERHMYNYQHARLSLALWQWLARQTTLHESLAVPLPKIGLPTEARDLAFQWATLSAFAQATTDQSPSAIQAAFQCWAELDQAQQNCFKDYYLLLAALAEHQLGADAAPKSWRSELARDRERRQGRLPMWMTEVAHRLGIEL
jgi:tetratricopeptide (TPR) repeat protein